ncbi:hypothetical protein [Pseudolysinimonas kribbensis]|uniref:hypothetical protein n=1 Tax=Pseudolysinimonas kribbensis TaxID=433641 RepID=UPI0024E14181|nr:hypothetical protein [Pseudolysinimonas kribbensis]
MSTIGMRARRRAASSEGAGSTSMMTAPSDGRRSSRVTQSLPDRAIVMTTSVPAAVAASSTPVSTPLAQVPSTSLITRSTSGGRGVSRAGRWSAPP